MKPNEITTISTNQENLSEKERELLSFALEAHHGSPVYKIKHFVGDAQITKYAKYRQFMLELKSREEGLEATLISVESKKAKLSALRFKHEQATYPEKEIIYWEIVTAEAEIQTLLRRLALAYDERKKYLDAIAEMYQNGEAYLEDGTDLKETFSNPELQEKMEAQHWIYRLGKQAALDLIAYGHIGTGNLEAISMLGQEDAVETLKLALTYCHGVKAALGNLEQSVLQELKNKPLPSLSIQDTAINDVRQLGK